MKYDGPGIVIKNGEIDYLYRVGIRAFIQNKKGEVLITDENSNGSWRLPGGGLNYEESIEECLARELNEELQYGGELQYEILAFEQPWWNEYRGAMQANIICKVELKDNMDMSVGIMRYASIDEILTGSVDDVGLRSSIDAIIERAQT
jgi:hypothetical protein